MGRDRDELNAYKLIVLSIVISQHRAIFLFFLELFTSPGLENAKLPPTVAELWADSARYSLTLGLPPATLVISVAACYIIKCPSLSRMRVRLRMFLVAVFLWAAIALTSAIAAARSTHQVWSFDVFGEMLASAILSVLIPLSIASLSVILAGGKYFSSIVATSSFFIGYLLLFIPLPGLRWARLAFGGGGEWEHRVDRFANSIHEQELFDGIGYLLLVVLCLFLASTLAYRVRRGVFNNSLIEQCTK